MVIYFELESFYSLLSFITPFCRLLPLLPSNNSNSPLEGTRLKSSLVRMLELSNETHQNQLINAMQTLLFTHSDVHMKLTQFDTAIKAIEESYKEIKIAKEAMKIVVELPMRLISIYASVCIPTSILVSVHIIWLLMHYRTGLFLKLIIISSLAYNIIQSILLKIDFDKYDDIYRIYCYYLLLTVLYIMYSFEIFIDPRYKVQIQSANHYQNRKSYHCQISDYETALPRIVSNATVQPQLQRELEGFNMPITVDSVIKVFPDAIPTFENKDFYFNEIDIEANNKEEPL